MKTKRHLHWLHVPTVCVKNALKGCKATQDERNVRIAAKLYYQQLICKDFRELSRECIELDRIMEIFLFGNVK